MKGNVFLRDLVIDAQPSVAEEDYPAPGKSILEQLLGQMSRSLDKGVSKPRALQAGISLSSSVLIMLWC